MILDNYKKTYQCVEEHYTIGSTFLNYELIVMTTDGKEFKTGFDIFTYFINIIDKITYKLDMMQGKRYELIENIHDILISILFDGYRNKNILDVSKDVYANFADLEAKKITLSEFSERVKIAYKYLHFGNHLYLCNDDEYRYICHYYKYSNKIQNLKVKVIDDVYKNNKFLNKCDNVCVEGYTEVYQVYDHYLISKQKILYNPLINAYKRNKKIKVVNLYKVSEDVAYKIYIEKYKEYKKKCKSLDIEPVIDIIKKGDRYSLKRYRDYKKDGEWVTKLTIPDFVTEIEPYAFKDCKYLKEINYYGIGGYENGIKKMEKAFSEAAFEEMRLDVYAKYIDDLSGLFKDCKNLRSLIVIMNTAGAKCMDEMFENCTKLENITFDKWFRTDDVKSMRSMFAGCKSLKTLDLTNHLYTDDVKDMSKMFANCNSLTYLRFHNFFKNLHLDNDKGAYRMFQNCESLQTIDFHEVSFLGKIENIDSMFDCCTAKHFNISNSINKFTFNSVDEIIKFLKNSNRV